MRKRVLVVDDEEDVRQFIRLMLEEAGYDVVTAVDGAQALALIDASPPDVVVLDLMMPVMDGWAVLFKLRGRRPPAVVIVSAFADPERASRAGAVAVLAKPFRQHELVEAIRTAV